MTQKLQNELDHIEKEYEEVVRAITKQGKLKCSEIKNAVNNMKARVETMRNQQIKTVQHHIIAINGRISGIGEVIENTCSGFSEPHNGLFLRVKMSGVYNATTNSQC